MSPNMKAFLAMIAISELGKRLIEISDDGYNVIVGSTTDNPILFHDYSDHPRQLVTLRPGLKSTAAGRYQILARYFDAYKKLLKLPDFSPESQDAIAVQIIREQRATADIEAGYIEHAIIKCNNIWASFPGSPYGQHTHTFYHLLAVYQQECEVSI